MSKIWTSPYEPVEVGGTTLPALVTARSGAALIDGGSGETVAYGALRTGAAVPVGPGEGLAL